MWVYNPKTPNRCKPKANSESPINRTHKLQYSVHFNEFMLLACGLQPQAGMNSKAKDKFSNILGNLIISSK